MSKKYNSNLSKYKKKKYSYSHKSDADKDELKKRLKKLKEEQLAKEKDLKANQETEKLENEQLEKQEIDFLNKNTDLQENDIHSENNQIDPETEQEITEEQKEELSDEHPEKNNQLIEHLKKYKKYYLPILAVLLTLIVYTTAFDNDFLNWDDDRYVTGNTHIEPTWENVKYYSTDFYFLMYIPLTMYSYMFDYSIVGLDSPQFYHAHSIFLHLVNTLLVYFFVLLLIKKIDKEKARIYGLISAILFGLHPMHVQSVTWISERKDVLFTAYFLASLIAYLFYTKKNNLKYYFLAIFLFCLSTLAKSQAVVLPVVIVLIDYFTNRISLSKENIKRFFVEKRFFKERVINDKILFFVLAAGFGVLTIVASGTNEPFSDNISTGQITNISNYSIVETVSYMSYGLFQYFNKLIAPYHLTAIHTYPQNMDGQMPAYLFLFPILLIGLIAAIIFAFIKKKKFIVFSILFFLVNIFLVLRIKNFIISEHYSYIPSISLNILIAYLYFQIVKKNNKLKQALNIILSLYIVFLGIFTFKRNDVYQNSETFWTDVLAKNSGIVVATYNRGNYYQRLGDKELANGNNELANEYFLKAIADYDSTVTKHKYNWGAFANRGVTLAKIGKPKAAIKDFNVVIKNDSTYNSIYSNRGNARVMLKDWKAAIKDYNRAIQLDSTFVDTYIQRGMAQKSIGNFEAAIQDFNKALELNSNNIQVYFMRAESYFNLKQYDKALVDINRQLEIQPESPYAYYYRALIYKEQGKVEKSKADFEILRTKYPQIIDGLIANATNYENNADYSGHKPYYKQAIRLYENILLINPKHSVAYSKMAVLKGKLGNLNDAIDDLNTAIKYDQNNIQAYADRGYAFFLLRNFQIALNDYNYVIQQDTLHATTYYNRGILFNNLKQFDKAILDFNKTLYIQPNNAMAFFNRAISYININQRENSCNDFQKSFDLGYKPAKQYLEKYCK